MKPFAFSNLLVATDLSGTSVPALRYARLLAARLSAKLTVLFTEPVVYPFDVGPVDLQHVVPTPEHLAQMRADVMRQADPIMTDVPYEVEATVGQPAAAILATAGRLKSELIVLGTHLRHGWRRAVLGSVSDAVLHGSRCPVLTVAGDEDAPGPQGITSVVCPVNVTAAAREAVGTAVGLARAFGARLNIVHVLEAEGPDQPRVTEDRVRRWIPPEYEGLWAFRELSSRGGPAERVLDFTEDVGGDLLVVGAQHRVFRDATVIGTNAERVIRFASCPVLVVPREAARGAASREEEEIELLTEA